MFFGIAQKIGQRGWVVGPSEIGGMKAVLWFPAKQQVQGLQRPLVIVLIRCGDGLAQLYRRPHVQHIFNSIPMQAFYNHKAIHQPYAVKKVCGLSSASVGKITSHSTQNKRGTVLYKDINIHLNGQGTVPLSSLTSFTV